MVTNDPAEGRIAEGEIPVRAHLRGKSVVRAHTRIIGIPDKNVSTTPEVGTPRVWEFAVQDHLANRAGRHFDLRLGDPGTGVAYSWAVPKAVLPEPGEKVLAVKQPDHTLEYMDFKGVIDKGYGAGTVDLHVRSKCEVVAATPDYVKFNLYTGKPGLKVSEYLLRRIEGARTWILHNITKKHIDGLPTSKESYKSIPFESLRTDLDDEVFQAKIDGAHVYVVLEPEKQVRVFSHRRSATDGGLIEHTWTIPELAGKKSPKELGKTILRGELWVRDAASKKAWDLPQVSGLLNSSVWNARERLKESGGEVVVSPFDVAKAKGVSESSPWEEKASIIKAFSSKFPNVVVLPTTAVTTAGKEAMKKLVASGDLEETKEGVVVHSLSGAPPKKSKIRDDYDVYVRDVFPAISGSGDELERAGGFSWSYDKDGPIVGRVGTGFSHDVLRQMRESPDMFVGRVARLVAQERLPSGSLRAPSFAGWHLDK